MKVGLLALQGAVGPHADALAYLGVATMEVRTPAQLDDVDALVVPGGESTTMSKLLVTSGVGERLRERLADGLPALGTCAGMIVLARTVLDGRADQQSYDAIDVTVRRNAFGRQVDSFEADLDVAGLDAPFHAVFIRAPFVEEAGEGVEVLAAVGGHPVLCRQGRVMVSAFHPELTADRRLHQQFLGLVG
ncbi:MAG: pyridoxal 5'-phosphate synthase glutaminase subunit PdxT [Acidimicrobiales bacterium]